ncbi:glycoprotein-N-acetylgalactosamine 3-beta-galactosyltransferase 1-like [Cloeon dipterum]|uniref:glycoprotein-N-acetylgalactosamine 3-beta-galactosyltransferase 1-like n=1 Tax=Cloeon dipterum TaxID=197152 RepID=UPI00321F9202
MTHSRNHASKAQTVRATWGRFCDVTLFVSDELDEKLFPMIKVEAPQGRDSLWHKVRTAFKFIHSNFSGKYDWVMKADDDTFVNVQSLREHLASFNPSHALYFGEPLVSGYFGDDSEYMGGGGGYVLSRETVDRFVKLLNDSRTDDEIGCDRHAATSGEDPYIGKSIFFLNKCIFKFSSGRCLHLLNVTGVDSRDRTGLNRFAQHPGPTRGEIWSNTNFWYWQFQKYSSTTKESNVGCCSSAYISYHYVSPAMMHQFQYLTFKVNPFDTSYVVRKA